jgi:hypothetical protein
MVALVLGLIVIGATTKLFQAGVNATFLVTQRAENQQNVRAGIELMTRDISMAGAGLPTGGIQLPTGAGSTPAKFGCDQTGACYVPNYDYNGNYLYGIVPGFNNGVQGGVPIPSAPGQINDSVTVAYVDYAFPLFQYTVTFPGPPYTGGSINLAPNPSFVPAPPAINSPGGIQVGDLIMLTNNVGTQVGEVTGLTPTTLTFADADPLNINQSGAASNNIKFIAGTSTTTAYRLFVVTYYLSVPGAGQTPRLMRQVNGLAPVPVADNIINLQVAYDIYNSTTNVLDANQANPLNVGESPNLIQKVNIVLMGQSLTLDGNKSQNMYLATSISARNMAFRNRYQ